MDRGLASGNDRPAAGVRFIGGSARARADTTARILQWLDDLGLSSGPHGPVWLSASTHALRVGLRQGARRAWAPGYDTLALAGTIGLDPLSPADLQREIALGLLASPIPFDYPDVDEFESAMRIRALTVAAARRTALDFNPQAIERPQDCWDYHEARGFTVRPGHELIAALEKATQPDLTGRLYAFSCYRATEYVMLLAIAREAALSNPPLLACMQSLAHRRAVQSREFHDVYLREYGSMRRPLPLNYFVPGDRVWFRNPDSASAQAEGYEGSWVIYLGGGLFCNFWQRDRPYTLQRKCLEIFHWRHALSQDAQGIWQIDEEEVERCVARSLEDPTTRDAILARMQRPRAPRGVYDRGGCMDSTRECARWVRPATCDISLPVD